MSSRQNNDLKVMIADDSKEELDFLRETLKLFLPLEASVYEFLTLDSCMNEAIRLQPQLIIMDNCFPESPELSGCKAAKELWNKCSSTSILIQSGSASDSFLSFLADAVPSTASYGFLLKRNSADFLEEAVKCLLSKDCWYDPEIFFPQVLELRSEQITIAEAASIILCAYGLSPDQIAKMLRISPEASRLRLKSLAGKLLKNPDSTEIETVQIAKAAVKDNVLSEALLAEAESFIKRQARKHGISLDSSIFE